MKDKDFVIKVKKKHLVISIVILVVIVLGVKFLPGNITNTNSKGNAVDVIVLNDERCKECTQVSNQIVSQLKELFPDLSFGNVDYISEEGKKLYEETGVRFLPAILFNNNSIKQEENYSQVKKFLEQKGDYLSLRINGANFDPTGEICDNEIDDNNNGKIDCDDESCKTNPACMETVCNDGKDDDDDGLVDCDDPDCKTNPACMETICYDGKDDEGDGLIDCDDPDCEKNWACMMPKKDKPEVGLFVMSYCPFGTQAEKGILSVLNLLGDKIDSKIRFCSYAMHGKKELDEQTLQYCIQKDYNDKYLDYLACFLKEGKTDDCLKEVELSGKLDKCIAETDTEFKITEKFNDKSTWSGGRYPLFDVDKESNDKYGVGGSPTLVINGVTAERVRRDSAGLLNAICMGFRDKPAECNEELSPERPSAGFGFEEDSSGSTGGQC